MKLEPFAMERLQSLWENRVDWNISESGVLPLRLEELVSSAEDRAALLAQQLGYTQTNGTPELRGLIAAMYPGAGEDHVEVTNGGSEANCIALMHLVQPEDEAIMMVPNYMQVGGLTRGLGGLVVPWPLVRDDRAGRWRPDLDRLSALVSDRTRILLICNPNNPTGARLTSAELDAIGRSADRVGAWVLSDEIYRGAELDGCETATMWGRAERVLVTGGLSKAYGLPGLRVGWIVGPPAVVEALWGVHDYTSIAPGALSDRLARVALGRNRRMQLLARTRDILNRNYAIVREWVESRDPLVDHVAPEAGAIAFVRYHHAVGSSSLAERLRLERGVLIVPGDHFEMDGYLRIGFGSDPVHLGQTLQLIGAVLETIPAGRLADAR
jgi:aspartate/methionine/tyrosine aminotransferase